MLAVSRMFVLTTVLYYFLCVCVCWDLYTLSFAGVSVGAIVSCVTYLVSCHPNWIWSYTINKDDLFYN